MLSIELPFLRAYFCMACVNSTKPIVPSFVKSNSSNILANELISLAVIDCDTANNTVFLNFPKLEKVHK